MLTLVAAAALLVGAAAWWQMRTGSQRIEELERRLQRATVELETLENAFTRFAPHEIVERIIAEGISTQAETKEITILFADLEDFTPMAEGLDPSRLLVLLNGYFERMGQAIAGNRGYLSKFLGDGLLALFGALEPNPWHTNDALHAALAMRAALADYNLQLAGQGLPQLAMGIGIHRGTVTAGVLGTSTVKEYGVLGRNVNLASRVENLTRLHRADILVTEAVRIRCDPRFQLRELPAAEAKGIAEPIVTYALEGFDAG
ncbi:MAG TPA: adenylate/guanylate cyclase domain-containing protein [Candidatus Binatia bacterium]|nr:adenylate/guanylate cyclase domain-containing protein [Candidatus Binatia bacterium]